MFWHQGPQSCCSSSRQVHLTIISADVCTANMNNAILSPMTDPSWINLIRASCLRLCRIDLHPPPLVRQHRNRKAGQVISVFAHQLPMRQFPKICVVVLEKCTALFFIIIYIFLPGCSTWWLTTHLTRLMCLFFTQWPAFCLRLVSMRKR